ncbi:MAG: methyltransferase domain-containing protein [Zoogloeaceae bacterium]|jgi:SAM-dependent methyltransferase|nr:methyltransferase domain-containing protein [Zoogloeaceae bacterium]
MNTEKIALRSCPVCGGKRAEILITMRYAVLENFPLPAASDIVCCNACGMVYADTSGTQADYDRYYADLAGYAAENSIGSGIKDAARQEQSADWLASRISAKNARIVDIGCARGGLLAALAQRGFSSLAGIDPLAQCITHLKASGFSAWQGNLNCLPADCGRDFDFIILSHVLEHVVDVHGTFVSLRKLLSPGGKVYLEVPDAACYHNGSENLPPFHALSFEHINHFDLPRLTMLGALHGFGVSEVICKNIGIGNAFEQSFAVGVLFAHGERHTLASPLSKECNATLRKAIAGYVSESQRLLNAQTEILSATIKNRPVAVWGMGVDVQRQMAHPVWKDANIVAVVDRDPRKQGKAFPWEGGGKRLIIQPPEEGLRSLPANTLVVITAIHYADEIKSELAAINANLPFLELRKKPSVAI